MFTFVERKRLGSAGFSTAGAAGYADGGRQRCQASRLSGGPDDLPLHVGRGGMDASRPMVFWCLLSSRGTDIPMHGLTRIVVVAALASCAASVRGEDSLLFANENRFYLAPIVGASWGTLFYYEPADPGDPSEPGQPIMNGNLFTAGGAAGVAFARDRGQLRLEFEGRYRDNFGTSREVLPGISASLQITDNWSTMANAWRDFSFTDRLGIYGGGGIGAGGYGVNPSISFGNDVIIGSTMTAFAWQAGGGVLYAFNERITLDLGYRFYSVGPGNSTLQLIGNGTPVESTAVSTSFATSEMLLSLRVYEPFRRWR